MFLFVTQYDIRLQHSFATWHTTCIPFTPMVYPAAKTNVEWHVCMCILYVKAKKDM